MAAMYEWLYVCCASLYMHACVLNAYIYMCYIDQSVCNQFPFYLMFHGCINVYFQVKLIIWQMCILPETYAIKLLILWHQTENIYLRCLENPIVGLWLQQPKYVQVYWQINSLCNN